MTLANIAELTKKVKEIYPNAEVSVPLNNIKNGVLYVNINDRLDFDKPTEIISKINIAGASLPQSIMIPLLDQYERKPYRVADMFSLRRALRLAFIADKQDVMISLPHFEKNIVTFIVKKIELSPPQKALPAPNQHNIIDRLVTQARTALQKAAPRKKRNLKQRPLNRLLQEKARGIYVFKEPTQTSTDKKEKKISVSSKIRSEKTKFNNTAPITTPSSIRKTPPLPQGELLSFSTIFADDLNEIPKATYTHVSNNYVWIHRNDEELYLIDIVGKDGVYISEQVETYQDSSTGKLKIPLSKIATALSFPIHVNANNGTATGFFIDETNTIELNIPERKLLISGKKIPYPDDDIEASSTDIFVSRTTLEKWFNINLDYSFEEQRLFVDSTATLPYQAFISRRNLWNSVEESRQKKRKTFDPDAPKHVLEREWFGKHAMRLNATNSSSRPGSDNKIDSSQSLNIQAQGDLFKMQSTITAGIAQTSNRSEINTLRLNLRQTDPDQTMLFGASQLEIGDIIAPSQPLVSTNDRGRGLFYSNQPVNAVRDPDNFTITGTAPVGWDIEVYQDTLLLDFLTVDSTGEYTFNTLPLNTGLNVFRVIQYGPNGEKKEYTEQFYLGPGIIQSGKLYYDVTALQSDEPLIPHGDRDFRQDSSLSTRFEYGINRKLSISGGLISGIIDNSKKEAVTFGSKSSIEQIFTQFDFMYQSDDAMSYRLSSRRQIGNFSDITLGWEENIGFNTDDRDELSRFYTTFSTNFNNDLFPLSMRAGYARETYQEQLTEDIYDIRLATNILDWSISNEFEIKKRNNIDETPIVGELTLRKRIEKGDIRSRLTYNAGHNSGLKSLSLRGTYNVDKNLNIQSSLTQNYDDGKASSSQFDARLGWLLGKVDLGVNLGASNDGSYSAGLNLTTYILPQANGYKLQDKSTGLNAGRVNIHAFLDTDNDLLFTPEIDKPMPDVTFQLMANNIRTKTNASGYALMERLQPYIPNSIGADTSTIHDIYIKPVFERMNVFSKPGQTGKIAYPLQYRGEIDGILYQKNQHGELVEMPDTAIALVSETGEITKTTITSFDGYFIIDNLAMGNYTIQMIDKEGEILSYDNQERIKILLSPNKPFSTADVIYTPYRKKLK